VQDSVPSIKRRRCSNHGLKPTTENDRYIPSHIATCRGVNLAHKSDMQNMDEGGVQLALHTASPISGSH
jgi:hypothetical protein